jgi:DNA polymerase-3 subunit delta
MLAVVTGTSLLGRVVFVNGTESFLASRAVERLVADAKDAYPGINVVTTEAADVTDAGQLAELTGASLFADVTIVVIGSIGSLPADVQPVFLALSADPPGEVALVCVHTGGQAGRSFVDKLRKQSSEVIDCPAVKAWELPQFVTAEVRRAGGRIDPEAAALVVDSVGSDLRALSGAAAQLVADAAVEGAIREADVRRYFAGRAEVSSFSVADAVMAGQTVVALERLRWALGTGVAPVLVTSALAGSLRSLGRYFSVRGGGRDADVAREVGVPPWKVKDLARQARSWSPQTVAASIQAVAVADAAIKGAQSNPDYALEQLVMTVISRRGM